MPEDDVDGLKEYTQSGHMDKLHILALLTRLRQLCCEPRLVYDNVEIWTYKRMMPKAFW